MTNLVTRTVADCLVPSAGLVLAVVLLASRVPQMVFVRPNVATGIDLVLVALALLFAIPVGITYADHRAEVGGRE